MVKKTLKDLSLPMGSKLVNSLDKHIGHRDRGGLAANQDFIYIIIYKLVHSNKIESQSRIMSSSAAL